MRKSKLRIHTYLYMVLVFVLLLLAFFAFTEVETVLYVASVFNSGEESIYEKYEEQYNAIFIGTEDTTESANLDIAIIGNSGDSMTTIVENELENLREAYTYIEVGSLLEIESLDRIEIYMVTTSDISLEEIEVLEEAVAQGKTIVFLEMPDDELLENSDVQNLLGIETYEGQEEFTGFRVAAELGFSVVQEQEEIAFAGADVEIVGTAKTYAYALDEDESIANEDLTPLMWRYVSGSGKVYVCNSEIFESQLAYSVLLQVFFEKEDVYIYPVVNACVLMVEGMPFAEDYTSEFLQETYNRSALNVQNFVFFPEFQTLEERYLINITWYSPDKEALEHTSSKELQYYLDEIEIEQSEIGKIEDGVLVSDVGFESYAIEWTSEFSYIDDENQVLNIPIALEIEEFDSKVINTTSMIKTMSMLAICIDVNDFMSDGEDYKEWTSFMTDCDTVLNYYMTEYEWMDVLTANEAAERIISYLSVEPEYEYEDNKVTVTIDGFNEDAYFHIMTGKTITQVTNGSVTEIGNGIYLLKADAEQVEIFFED